MLTSREQRKQLPIDRPGSRLDGRRARGAGRSPVGGIVVRATYLASRAVRVAIVFAVALAAVAPTGANATGRGTTASACSNERIGSATSGEDFYAFVLHGPVSCSQGHSVVRSYLRRVSAGCPLSAGNICALARPGGWECTLRLAASERFDAGCSRGAARVQVYVVSPPASWRGTLHMPLFASPDGSTLCTAFPPMHEVLCAVASGREAASYSGEVRRDGHVALCNEPLEGHNCLSTETNNPPVLGYGQQTELNGIRCSSATNGITCTVVSGPGAGKGFRINENEAVNVG